MILKSDLQATIEAVVQDELEDVLTEKQCSDLVTNLVDRIQQEHEVFDDASEADGDADERNEED